MSIRILALPLKFLPWKLLAGTLFVIGSISAYVYSHAGEYVSTFANIPSPTPAMTGHSPMNLRPAFRAMLLWLVGALMIPVSIVPFAVKIFMLQKNSANAILLCSCVAGSVLLAGYLFYSLLSAIPLIVLLVVLTAAAVFLYYRLLSWLERHL